MPGNSVAPAEFLKANNGVFGSRIKRLLQVLIPYEQPATEESILSLVFLYKGERFEREIEFKDAQNHGYLPSSVITCTE